MLKRLLWPLWFVLTTVNTSISSKNYFLIRVLILSALVKYFKGTLEHKRKDYRKALSFFTEGIELKCKDDETNVILYSSRSHLHSHLGKLTLLLLFLIFYLSECKYLSSKCKKYISGFLKTVSIICAKTPIFHFDLPFLKPASKPCKERNHRERTAIRGR